MRSWSRPQSGMPSHIDFDEKRGRLSAAQGSDAPPGDGASTLEQHHIGAAVAFVTLPASANGRARTQNNFARWRIRYLFTPRTE